MVLTPYDDDTQLRGRVRLASHHRQGWTMIASSHISTDELMTMLANVEKQADGWTSCCPAHDDTRNSLSITRGDDGRTLLHCHAGCDFATVVQSLGLRQSQLMAPKTSKPVKTFAPIVNTYDYRDETGALLYQVCRKADKTFTQRRPDGNGGWVWSVKGVRPVPYRLLDILKDTESSVFIVEGEKDADRLASL